MPQRQRTSDATVIRLHPLDNVVVAARALTAGAWVESETVRTLQAVAPGHKLAWPTSPPAIRC